MDVTALGTVSAALFGAIVGSFLNVVIYRLPRGLSVHSPRWSFCPLCEHRIAARANVPVFGWLMLGGRCADCRAPISMMYPAVEAATALIFVTIWDALFVARVVPGTTALGHDWPILLSHLFLFGALLASAVMDIESYTIHIQVLLLAMGVGVVGQAVAGLPQPRGTFGGNDLKLLPVAICAVALVMGFAWLATMGIGLLRGTRGQGVEPGEPAAESCESDHPPSEQLIDLSAKPSAAWRFQPIPIVALIAAIIGLIAWQTLTPLGGLHAAIPPYGQRAFVATFVLLLMLIVATLEKREADQQIVEDLERERPMARAMVAREMSALLPALLAGLAVLVILRRTGFVSLSWQDAMRHTLAGVPWPEHVAGGVHALAATILSAALGWTVRIMGTFAFGKEAFGSGDIYILAAIGAVGGLWVVAIGFLLAAVLALVGVVATSFHKSSRAIPFGPWLALGAFVAVWVQEPLTRFFSPLGWLVWTLLSGQPV